MSTRRSTPGSAPHRPADDDSLFGYMKDTIKIEGDMIAPVGEEWSALSGDEDWHVRVLEL